MSKAISFHPQNHKWFPAPDFTAIALSDETKISEALDIVLRAKRRVIGPVEKDLLVETIESFAHGDNVGKLRELDEQSWKKLNIPFICRIYLKHLIIQSCSLTFQQLLECDFNNGLPYDWESIQDNVTELLQLGFSRDEALESIIVTGNKQVDLAAQYLLSKPETRKLERERCKKEYNKCVPPNRHYTIIEQAKKEKEEQIAWIKKTENELLLQITKIRLDIANERLKREELEKKRDETARSTKLALYQEFLKGITCDPKINPNEQQQIETYKTQRKIDQTDHLNVIKELGYEEETFDKLKTYDDVQTNNDECIVCYEPPRDHMLIPCHHVCLCAECAEGYKDGDTPCPLCHGPVSECRQVFYF